MIHRLSRRHYFEIEKNRWRIASEKDSSFTYLNLNINSQCRDPYVFYPPLRNGRLASTYLQEVLRSDLKEESLLFTQGSTESIDLIIRAFCEPGKDSILVTPPTFPYYAYRARIENVHVETSPLRGDDLNELNVSEILASSAKVLFLCSPNNPVGTLLNLDSVEQVIREFSGIVVLDEAYIEWTNQPTCIEWVKKYDHLIVLRTFSKIWGLAGARCGATVADQSIIDTLSFVQPMFGFSDSSADLVLSKLKKPEALVADKSAVELLRQDFFNFLQNLPFVEKVYPGVANFLLVAFHDAEAVEQRLLRERILVSNASHQVPNTLRISIGSEEEMQRIKHVLT